MMKTPPTHIELVMWDFGGVFTGSPFHGTAQYAERLGTTAAELADLVLGYDQPDGEHPWHRLERGELSMIEAGALVNDQAAAAGLEGFSLGAFFESMGGLDGARSREAMLAVVGRVQRAGIKNIIVTNNIAEMGERWRSLLPEGLFDGIVDSSHVGVRKPDPTIFRLALDTMGGIPPARTVFLDDHQANVDAAEAMGVHAIRVGPDPLEAAARLTAMLGL